MSRSQVSAVQSGCAMSRAGRCAAIAYMLSAVPRFCRKCSALAWHVRRCLPRTVAPSHHLFHPSSLSPVRTAGFIESIRNFVAHVIDTTYQVADASLIGTMLGGLTGTELEAFAAKRGWKPQDGGKFFIASQQSLVQSKNIMETLSFSSLIPVMAHSK